MIKSFYCIHAVVVGFICALIVGCPAQAMNLTAKVPHVHNAKTIDRLIQQYLGAVEDDEQNPNDRRYGYINIQEIFTPTRSNIGTPLDVLQALIGLAEREPVENSPKAVKAVAKLVQFLAICYVGLHQQAEVHLDAYRTWLLDQLKSVPDTGGNTVKAKILIILAFYRDKFSESLAQVGHNLEDIEVLSVNELSKELQKVPVGQSAESRQIFVNQMLALYSAQKQREAKKAGKRFAPVVIKGQSDGKWAYLQGEWDETDKILKKKAAEAKEKRDAENRKRTARNRKYYERIARALPVTNTSWGPKGRPIGQSHFQSNPHLNSPPRRPTNVQSSGYGQ